METPEQMDDVKPCWRCMKKPNIRHRAGAWGANCHCFGDSNFWVYGNSKEQVIERWNTRVSDASAGLVPVPVELLKELCATAHYAYCPSGKVRMNKARVLSEARAILRASKGESADG